MTPDFPEFPELEELAVKLQYLRHHFISQLKIKLKNLYRQQRKEDQIEADYAEDILEPSPWLRVRSISEILRTLESDSVI